MTLRPEDRCSQAFNLTFDLSVHDIFVSWDAGACLYPLSANDLLAPHKFIQKHELTVWFSVPAVAMVMQRMRTLRPEAFPSLRCSLFCGEALPQAIARDWAVAAPNSRLLNLYGPTEATIAITYYEWQADLNDERYGLVPIGQTIGDQRAHILDQAGELMLGAGRGELALEGDQVTRGYLNAPEQTAAAYAGISGQPDVHCYRTGDLVERDDSGNLYYVSRIDSQVKLRGHRIELQEVDRALRTVLGFDLAVAVVLPIEGPAKEIVGIVASSDLDTNLVLDKCKGLLPKSMIPSRLILLDELPVNANGKIDRKAAAAKVATL